MFNDFTASPQLTNEQCIWLLYLLPLLANGNGEMQKAATQTITAPCNAFELPNSNFYNTLVYYNLMCLADPLGVYVRTNTQIQELINAILPAVCGNDAGSIAVYQALFQQSRILLVTASYPMMDPYNPATGFNTRKADILNALNTTWASLHKPGQ